jgi:hypothetical protein
MRRMLLLAAAALLAPVALPAHAAADDAPRSLELALPHAAGAAPHWRTRPLRAAGGFDVVGGEWRGGGARVELRARRADGRWTRWARVVAGEPVWSGPALAVQLRGARAVRGLRVHAVSVGATRRERAPQAVAATGGGPAIVPRSAWDPQHRCRPRVAARYGRIDFAVVHHTESLSSYPPGASAAIVLGICLFHRDGNGWNDIGYDLLVDRFGTIFEGRAGGVEQPTIGAQAGGWNAVSTGVAMIGSYTLSVPPPAALHALERVLAWKLSLAGVPAQGGVVDRSIGGERGVNAHPRGTLVRFQRIAGHRDADFTDCPGGALYAELPAVRRAVAALMPAPRDLLTISPVGAPIEQAPWPLSGRLALASGRRPAGAAVRVEQQGADGSWRAVAVARTGADGIWSATPALAANGALRAVATAGSGELISAAVPAQVRTAVRLDATRTRLRRRGTLQVAGTTSPPKPLVRVRVRIERRTRAGAFRPLRTLIATTDADGRFSLATRLSLPGAYRVGATTPADLENAAGTSRPLALRVR